MYITFNILRLKLYFENWTERAKSFPISIRSGAHNSVLGREDILNPLLLKSYIRSTLLMTRIKRTTIRASMGIVSPLIWWKCSLTTLISLIRLIFISLIDWKSALFTRSVYIDEQTSRIQLANTDAFRSSINL